MKTRIYLWCLPLTAALVISGCSKSDQPAAGTGPVTVTTINATQLRPAFGSPTPEVSTLLDNVMMAIRSSKYDEALTGLDALGKTAGVTDAQKKVLADLTDQIKKKAESQAPKAGQ